MTCSTSWAMGWAPSVAMAMTRPERAGTSWMLERVFSYLGAPAAAGVGAGLRGDGDDGEDFVDEGVGAVFHLAGGVAFGVDVGDLLELERAFEGDGVVDAAAEEEEVVGGGEDFGEGFALAFEGEARAGAA